MKLFRWGANRPTPTITPDAALDAKTRAPATVEACRQGFAIGEQQRADARRAQQGGR